MKGQKGEGPKQNQSKGALGVAEAGPLFPRLHVNETEKAGPKAPPRNKMALYEQFTVPSHRFVQPSPKPATTMYQQQYGIHELGYPYVPYYAPSGPNHGVYMNARPSHNTSSSGAISSSAVNDGLRQMAPRPNKDGKTSPSLVSRQLTEGTVDCAVKSLPRQKDNVAVVSTQSSLTNQTEEPTIISVQNMPSDMEVTHIPDITESLQEALSAVEVGTECTGPDVKRCEFLRGQVLVDSVRSTSLTVDNKLKQATKLSIFETLTQPTKEGASGSLDKTTLQPYLITESSRDECNADCGTQALTSHASCTTHSGTSLEPKGVDGRLTVNADCRSPISSENQVITGQRSAPTSGEILENDVNKNASKNFTTDVGKVDMGVGGFSKPSIAISEELKGLQNGNSEVSQTSQSGSNKGEHSNGLLSTTSDLMCVIKPKDVIRAVGQQQFWKARKKLLCQQRIFSDQVFQLHKLIKIQQLLAETPGTLIDEEMHLDTREEIDAATPAKRATKTSEDAYKMGLYFNEGRNCKSAEAEEQPRNKWGQTQADEKAGLGSNKCGPGMNSVGLSAWGYPSLGPWGGPIAAPGGPFNCKPFGGSLPPGTAFGFPFGPWSGSAASMMSFGIPYYERKQELPAEVDSNYEPPTALEHVGIGSVSSNHMSNDLTASWYFAQHNHLNNHRLLAGVSKKESPTGSGASVNKSSATAQAVKATCFPGLSYHWGLEAGPLNAQQSESSLPSDACRLDGRKPSTSSVPAAKSLGFTHQDGGLARDLDAASAPRKHYGGIKRLVEKEKPVTRTLNHSKHQEDAVCSSVDCPDGNDYTSDVNSSALELFPLVPSLSSSGWSRGGVLKAAEEGQVGVIRAVPRRAKAASKSAAGILLSLQRERQQ